jgi:hypothetical protein
MTLDEARTILKNPRNHTIRESGHAAVVLGKFYRTPEGKRLLRPATDLIGPTRTPTRDAAPGPSPFVEGPAGVRADYRQARSPERAGGGLKPEGGAVGATLVMKLPGPATAYFIALDPNDGSAALYRSSDVEGIADLGQGEGKPTRTRDFVSIARQRVMAEQQHNQRWAKSISDFWKKQQSSS